MVHMLWCLCSENRGENILGGTRNIFFPKIPTSAPIKLNIFELIFEMEFQFIEYSASYRNLIVNFDTVRILKDKDDSVS